MAKKNFFNDENPQTNQAASAVIAQAKSAAATQPQAEQKAIIHRKPEDKRKTKRLNLVLTQADFDKLAEAAEGEGLSINAFVTSLIRKL